MVRFLSGLRLRLSRHLSPSAMRAVRPFLTIQFIIFMAMGILNTIVSVGTATLLDVMNILLLPSDNLFKAFAAQSRLNFIIGYVVSLITSFFLNSRITFHQKPTWKNFLKFPISYIPNFVFQYLMVLLFTSLRWNSTLAYICAAIFGTPMTFAAMRIVVFRKKKKNSR